MSVLSRPLPRPDWSLWVTAAALAVAAHAGAFNFVRLQLPDPPPPPVETEIVIDTIEIANMQVSATQAAEIATSTNAAQPETLAIPGAAIADALGATSTPNRAAPSATADTASARQAETQGATNTEAARASASTAATPVERLNAQQSVSAATSATEPDRIIGQPVGAAAPPQSAPAATPEALQTAPSSLVPANGSTRIVGQPVRPEASEPSDPQAVASPAVPQSAPAQLATAPLVTQSVVAAPPVTVAPRIDTAPVSVATAIEASQQATQGEEIGALQGADVAPIPTVERSRVATVTDQNPPTALPTVNQDVTPAAPERETLGPLPEPSRPTRIASAQPATPPAPQDVTPVTPERETLAVVPEAPPTRVPEAAPTASLPAPISLPEDTEGLSEAVVAALAKLAQEAEESRPAPAQEPEDMLALAAPERTELSPQRLTPTPLRPSTPTATAVAPVTDIPSGPSESSADGLVSDAPAPAGEVSAGDRARYAAILEFMKSYDGGGCFAALPALGEETGVLTLDAFGETTKRLDVFKEGLDGAAGIVPNTYLKPVSEAQCATLSFIRAAPRYPAFTTYFELERREIPSGDTLTGRIYNTGGQVLHLLLIDDEGTVQTLDSFVRFRAAAAEFSIPMTFQGGPIVTQQLLLAVVSPKRLATVRDMNGKKADAFFAALAREQKDGQLRVDLSMVAFNVK